MTGTQPQRALYHENGLRLTFESSVVAQGQGEVALDATAFYPEGGGQRADTGTLHWSGGEARVTDTRKDKATGVIWHAVEGPLPPVGVVVAGEIDRARRWRHMQRHSGEHLLAQAFLRINPAFQVVAVSMNSPECHLDLKGDPAEAQVRAAEALLRETLGRDELTLFTPIIPEAQLGHYPLRRETKVTGEVRLVMFRDSTGEYFDVSACGGTHVPRAAMCAPVVVLRTERIKGGLTRVTFMAGEEASEYLSGVYREARALAQGFSVPVERLTGRVQALGEEKEALKAELEAVRAELAAQLLSASVPQQVQGHPVHFLPLTSDALLLPVLGSVRAGEVVVALASSGRCGIGSGLVAADAGAVLRSALQQTGGKGGGKLDLAQGSTATPDAFFAAAQRELEERLSI